MTAPAISTTPTTPPTTPPAIVPVSVLLLEDVEDGVEVVEVVEVVEAVEAPVDVGTTVLVDEAEVAVDSGVSE